MNNKKTSKIAYNSVFMVLSISYLLHFSFQKDNNFDGEEIFIDETLENESVAINIDNKLEQNIIESYEKTIIESTEESIEDNRKLVAITFDDGPSKHTDELIDLLNKYDVKATFFVIKSSCENYPEQLSIISDNGNEIAIHGATHTSFNKLSNTQVKNEITSTVDYIEELGLSSSHLVKPPYMQYNKNLLNNIEYPFILWNIDTNDWKHHNANKIKKEIINNIDDGCIILMHDRNDVHECDISALEEILPELIKEYKFVTVSELANEYNTELEAGKVYKLIKNQK